MTDKPIIETAEKKSLLVTIEYVFKANFNDSYLLEEVTIDLDGVDREQLVWFDPYNGRSKINQTLVAIAYCSDDKLILLKKENGVITEMEKKPYIGCFFSEDYDNSMLLASNITLR